MPFLKLLIAQFGASFFFILQKNALHLTKIDNFEAEK